MCGASSRRRSLAIERRAIRRPDGQYAFGVAVFDNAQVRHAYSPGVYKLKFE